MATENDKESPMPPMLQTTVTALEPNIEILFQLFRDTATCTVTEIGKPGAVLYCTYDGANTSRPMFVVEPMFGGRRDEDGLEIFIARQLSQLILPVIKRPMVVCVGLKQHRIGEYKAIMTHVVEAVRVMLGLQTEPKRPTQPIEYEVPEGL